MHLVFFVVVCTLWFASGGLAATWWFTRRSRRLAKDLDDLTEWLEKLPKVEDLPPVRTLPQTYQGATWARPHPPKSTDLPTGVMWAPVDRHGAPR